MEEFVVSNYAMSLVYDLVAQEPRKNLRGTDSWRIFWSAYPIKMATYTSTQKGKLWRILGNHSRVKEVVCMHQLRFTIPIVDCVPDEANYRFKVEEIRQCTCDGGKQTSDELCGDIDFQCFSGT